MTEENSPSDPQHERSAVTDVPEAASSVSDHPAKEVRPDWLPEKFWDEVAGAPRLQALANSYSALEKKLGRTALTSKSGTQAEGDAKATFDGGFPRESSVPDRPEDYPLTMAHPALEPDPEINRELHRLGFTSEQAQFVYDLAATHIMPLLEDLSREQADEMRRIELVRHFGGEERFEEVARQVSQWGRANLPEDLFATLSENPDGIIAMHAMMRSGEPRFLSGRAQPKGRLDEAGLKKLVDDPRYWRDHDPDIVSEVEEGFRRLYPD